MTFREKHVWNSKVAVLGN